MPADLTKQTEDSISAPVTSYTLTEQERLVFQTINQGAINAKLTIYNLNMQLERAMKARDSIEAQSSGALALLATAHGLQAPSKLSDDFTRIETVKG